jgi:hypothetical protein
MKKIELHQTFFDIESVWVNPLPDISIFNDTRSLDLFDQNGYHLTKLEQSYAEVNGYPMVKRRHETVLRQNWMTMLGPMTGAHFNHCDLFERKAYAGSAKDQLLRYSKYNHMLWKLIKMMPKYGIDVSIDYVDEIGNVFEIFHYEWDTFEYDKIRIQKMIIEDFVMSTNWDEKANELLDRRDEWYDLEFFAQSKWRTDFFGLPEERFKQVIWTK